MRFQTVHPVAGSAAGCSSAVEKIVYFVVAEYCSKVLSPERRPKLIGLAEVGYSIRMEIR